MMAGVMLERGGSGMPFPPRLAISMRMHFMSFSRGLTSLGNKLVYT